jgi:hypothetical protein
MREPGLLKDTDKTGGMFTRAKFIDPGFEALPRLNQRPLFLSGNTAKFLTHFPKQIIVRSI